MDEEQLQRAKKAVGKKAAECVQNNMSVGLGTGSTAFWFIESLSERCKKEGLVIRAVASSNASSEHAKKVGIPLVDINTLTFLDLAVDGADEIDPQKRLIKGGGGALLREKIIASMSKEFIVIVDETKMVPHLGKHKFPVEITPFGATSVIYKINQLGLKGALRMGEGVTPFITDNHNYIYDIRFSPPYPSLEELHAKLIEISGVVETGFFPLLSGRVIIGFLDGEVVLL